MDINDRRRNIRKLGLPPSERLKYYGKLIKAILSQKTDSDKKRKQK